MPHALSVVIPAYNNWWLTQRCVLALKALRVRSSVDFEIVVVDNASNDETPAQLAKMEGIRTLRLDRNANFAGAANAGAAVAEAPIVLFLNNDAWPMDDDPLSPLLASFERGDVVIAGGALFYEDGVTQAAGCVLLPNAHWFASCRNLPAALDQVRTARDLVAVPGAAIAVRKDWFAQSGAFDTTFRNGFEDADLCMRARSERLVTHYASSARFAHYEGATLGRFAWESRNEEEFYRRWASALAEIPRVDRGEVGAVVVRRNARELSGVSALEDLIAAIRSYGHPVVESLPSWRRLDRRFRIAATLAWNCDGAQHAPSVEVRAVGDVATLRTHGAVSIEVPWMPCADFPRPEGSPPTRTSDPYGYARLQAEYDAGGVSREDALRRGNPRRSAMRVIDLLRVARFGLERPGTARSSAPITLKAPA